MSWYRTAGIDGAVAEIVGEMAEFSWSDEFGYSYATGYLEVSEDNTAILTLTESDLPYIDAGSYSFQRIGTEEEYAERLYTSVLQMNDDGHIWMSDSYNGGNDLFG